MAKPQNGYSTNGKPGVVKPELEENNSNNKEFSGAQKDTRPEESKEQNRRYQFEMNAVSMRKLRVLENVVNNVESYFSEIMPIIGSYNQASVSRMLANGKQNIVLGSNANKISKDSTAYPAYIFDVGAVSLVSNLYDISMQPVNADTVTKAASQFLAIANEMWSKIGSYAMSNANLFQWQYDKGSKVITGDVKTDTMLAQQYITRATATIIRCYDLIRGYESKMMDEEYLNDDSKMSVLFAELKRSRWYSNIDILRQRVSKQYFDYQSWELEDAAVVFPSKQTDGFDSMIKQVIVSYSTLDGLSIMRASKQKLSFTAMLTNINNILDELNMFNMFVLVRTKTVAQIKAALETINTNITQLISDWNDLVIALTDLQTQYTLLNDNGLLNDRWKSGYYIEKFRENLPFFFNLSADAIIKVAGVGQATISTVTPSTGISDNNSYGYQLLTILSKTEGIPTIYADQIKSLYAFIGKPVTTTGLVNYVYKPYELPTGGYKGMIINRKGDKFTITTQQVDAPGSKTNSRGLAQLSILEGSAKYLVPTITVTSSANKVVSQAIEAAKQMYDYAIIQTTGSGSNETLSFMKSDAITEVALLMEPVYAFFEFYYQMVSPFKFN